MMCHSLAYRKGQLTVITHSTIARVIHLWFEATHGISAATPTAHAESAPGTLLRAITQAHYTVRCPRVDLTVSYVRTGSKSRLRVLTRTLKRVCRRLTHT